MEYGFPVMGSNPAWNVVAENVFAEFVSRWNLDKATCNGGLKWQYTESNSGYYYKNTVSNGAMFQTAARLARFYQGENTTYTEWANTVWDWTVGVGFISADYNVYDGAGDDGSANCTAIDEDQWTYNLGTYLHGAAHMFNVTDDSVWETRVQGLLATAKSVFFDNGVLYEQKCEPTASCSYDNVIFKASLARWMAKTAVLVPSVKDEIMSLLATSASGAAQACVGLGNSTCGVSWTKGGYDGSSYFGNELSALETIQSLLVFNAPRLAVASSKNTT
ncbi:glycoside hydrolase [Xylariaceae sp. FL0255]|nr:glycoside hydrolase [Xylariaceae sp. FL0255]